jgi:hypothetical protein
MFKINNQLPGLFLVMCILTGCETVAPVSTSTPTSTVQLTLTLTPEPSITPTATIHCATAFEQRELKEPYQRRKAGQPRFTLSETELNDYLALMGIESVCMPEELGAPFLNVDWDSRQIPGAQGRMVSLGFENLYPGSGWSSGYVLYSTYDFKMGTEYDVFARLEDRDALKQGVLPDLVEVNGAPGFIRMMGGLYPGTLLVQKAVVFPFEAYYVAVVYQFWGSDPEDANAVQQIKDGEYPAEYVQQAQALDAFIQSIHFDQSHY